MTYAYFDWLKLTSKQYLSAFRYPIAQKFTISIRRTHKIHLYCLDDFLTTVRLVQAVFCGRLNLCSFSLSWRSSLTILRASSNNTKLSQKKTVSTVVDVIFSQQEQFSNCSQSKGDDSKWLATTSWVAALRASESKNKIKTSNAKRIYCHDNETASDINSNANHLGWNI